MFTSRPSRHAGLSLALVSSLGMAGAASAGTDTSRQMSPAAPVLSSSISEADVLVAQRAWGDALVAISRDHEEGGFNKAKATAARVLDSAYGYSLGPVLFKPTLTTAPQTFRPTREGALSYFVGGNTNFPQDKGFALNGWRSVEIRNMAIHLQGRTALSMGNVLLTDKRGKVTTVDKTWGYVRDDKGALRIVLHHSSLPVTQ